MNVTCPQCATVFRVDPAKVPERGVRARCSVCGGLIAVRRPPVAAPTLPRETAAAIGAPPSAPPPAPPAPRVETPLPPAPMPPAPEPPPVPVPAPMPDPLPPVAPPIAPPVEFSIPPLPPPAVSFSALPREAAPPPSAPSGSAQRFNNPFLQQDPSTRARRLARALISDLVVYHPEKRQRGLVEGNLKELFAEEIRKSWEEYTEQVGEDVAQSTPYFTEALNEILAEGRSLF